MWSQVRNMVMTLQQRVQSAQLKGGIPITSRHITALLRSIFSALQGPQQRHAAEVELQQLEQELKAQQGSEQALVHSGQLGSKEAEILRTCVAKAGPSVFDSLDTAIKAAKDVSSTASLSPPKLKPLELTFQCA